MADMTPTWAAVAVVFQRQGKITGAAIEPVDKMAEPVDKMARVADALVALKNSGRITDADIDAAMRQDETKTAEAVAPAAS